MATYKNQVLPEGTAGCGESLAVTGDGAESSRQHLSQAPHTRQSGVTAESHSSGANKQSQITDRMKVGEMEGSVVTGQKGEEEEVGKGGKDLKLPFYENTKPVGKTRSREGSQNSIELGRGKAQTRPIVRSNKAADSRRKKSMEEKEKGKEKEKTEGVVTRSVSKRYISGTQKTPKESGNTTEGERSGVVQGGQREESLEAQTLEKEREEGKRDREGIPRGQPTSNGHFTGLDHCKKSIGKRRQKLEDGVPEEGGETTDMDTAEMSEEEIGVGSKIIEEGIRGEKRKRAEAGIGDTEVTGIRERERIDLDTISPPPKKVGEIEDRPESRERSERSEIQTAEISSEEEAGKGYSHILLN
ncbi:unnamed protein product [Diatraea saccharalis]|uniref:Uncharacterized protein n=1 Tax=Diatraea saccharalis TaxID=40085 RepID=A0A9N9WKT1_9NEOP|nr:unnamed protein product [Diatraea saccharalis]